MERQKVLYVAKTKTAKVIRPSLTKQQPPSASLHQSNTQLDHAPLASVEPEFATSRLAAPTNVSLHGQTRKVPPASNVCKYDKPLRMDLSTLKSEHPSKEVVRDVQPRTYAKMRTSNDALIRHENHNDVIKEKSNKPRPGEFFSCGTLLSETKPYINVDHNVSSNDRLLQTASTQKFRRDEIGRRTTIRFHGDRRIDTIAKRITEHKLSNTISKNNSSIEQSSFTKTPPLVAPKPKRICTKATAASQYQSNLTNVEHDQRNSKHSFPPASVVDQNSHITFKENYSEPFQTFQENMLGLPLTKDKLQSSCESEYKSQSPNNILAATKQTNLHNYSTMDNSNKQHIISTSRSDITVPTKFSFHNKNPLHEMYTFSAPLNVAEVRPKTARRPVLHTNQNYQHKSGPRKPLAAIDTSFNTRPAGFDEINNNIQMADHLSNERILLMNNGFQHTNSINNVDKVQSTEDRITSISQTCPATAESTNLFSSAQEFRNSWNRSSMKLATHGYTSMSDLTNSLEYLTDNPAEAKTLCHQEIINNKIRQTEVTPLTVSTKEEGAEDCKNALITKETHKRAYEAICDNESNGHGDKIKELAFQEEPATLQRSGTTRLSYRMATSTSMTDISLLEDELRGLSNNCYQTCVIAKNNKNLGLNFSKSLIESQEVKTRDGEGDSSNKKQGANNLRPETQVSHVQDDLGSKLKRLSFTLATCSISDLTFHPYVNYDNADFRFAPHASTNSKSSNTSKALESANNSSLNTPESMRSQVKDGSCYSSGRHSSFGSVYSYQSLDSGKSILSLGKSVTHGRHQKCRSAVLIGSPSVHPPHSASDSSDSDGSVSIDTTFYYTASSDTSFITTNGDVSGCPNFSGLPNLSSTQLLQQPKRSVQSPLQQHQSPLQQNQSPLRQDQSPPRQDQSPLQQHQSPQNVSPQSQTDKSPQNRWSPKIPASGRKSPKLSTRDKKSTTRPDLGQGHNSCSNNQEEIVHSYLDDIHGHSNSLTSNDFSFQRFTPTNNVHHFHGSRLNDLMKKAQTQHHVNTDFVGKGIPPVDSNLEKNNHSIDEVHGDNCNYSTDDSQATRLNISQRRLALQAEKPTVADLSDNDECSTRSLASSSSFCSIYSFEQDSPNDGTPRFPPSLGKPRRKLYAGFDSQPLPMDSFISDSSSIYSMQTCGSWGTSRSAEVESSSRTHKSPNIRAVSSIVSSTHTPVRCMSQEEMLDLLKFTDKMFPAGESSHNIFPNGRSKYNSNKSYSSSESLQSSRSDDTVVGDDRSKIVDHELADTKLGKDTKVCNGGMYNNSRISEYEKLRNERRHLDKLNNSCGQDFGSRLSNNTFVAGSVVTNKNQLKLSKGKKSGQPSCLCRQSSLDRLTIGDGSVSVILRDTGQWDISL